jgi:hypothetical protein
MVNNQDLDKNSTYDELHAEVRKTGIKVKNLIPLMCWRYEKENKSKGKDEVREKVRRDCIAAGYNYDYVTKWIPDEFKDYVRSVAGTKGGQATAQVMKGGSDEHGSLPKEGASGKPAKGTERTEDSGTLQKDLVNLMDKLEQAENRLTKMEEENKILRDALELKKRAVDTAEKEDVTDRLEAAEMEVKFLKGEGVGEKLIPLKGNKADGRGQFYYGLIAIPLLVRQVQGLISSGIKVVEVYMVAK